jgi:hypothetical protein
MKGQSTVERFAMALLMLSGAHASACQMSWKSPGEPEITSISGHLVTSSGEKVNCKVADHYLLELAFRLVCANGSTVEIGRSPYCGRGPQEWPECDYGLLVDRSRQAFKLREEAYPHQSACANGLASTVFGYRLSQATFSFEAFVEVKGPQQKEKRPVGF